MLAHPRHYAPRHTQGPLTQPPTNTSAHTHGPLHLHTHTACSRRINGLTHLNLTKLDVLDQLEEIKVGGWAGGRAGLGGQGGWAGGQVIRWV